MEAIISTIPVLSSMNKRILLIALLINCFAVLKAQPPQKPAELFPLIKKSAPDTNRIALLNRLGGYYIFKPGNFKNDLDSALNYLNKALVLGERLHSVKGINETLKLKGDCYLEGEDLENGYACFKQVTDYYHKTGNKQDEGKTWVRWGDCITSRHLQGRIECYKRAIPLLTNTDQITEIDALLSLSDCYNFKSNGLKTNLDSAMRCASLALSLSIRLHQVNSIEQSLIYKAKCFLAAGNITQAKPVIKAIMDPYHKPGGTLKEAKKWLELSDDFSFSFYSQEGSELCKINALYILKRLPVRDRSFEIHVSKSLADNYLNDGKLDLAEKGLLNVLSDYKKIGFRRLHFTYDLLAAVYALKGYPDKELYYRLLAISSENNSGDTSYAQHFNLKLGQTYLTLRSYDKSLFYLNKVLSHVSPKDFSYESYFEALNYKCLILVKQGKAAMALQAVRSCTRYISPVDPSQKEWLSASYAICYQALKQYDKAEKYYLDVVEQDNDASYTRLSLKAIQYELEVVSVYIAMKNYKKASAYLMNVIEPSTKILAAVDLGRVHLFHFQIDSANGNFFSSIRHYQQYKRLNDSIFNLDKNKQLQELEVKYETQQRKIDIASLENTAKMQRADLKRINIQRNLTLIGIVLVLIIAGFAYTAFRQKRRSNLLLQAHQREIDGKNDSLQQLNYKQQLLLIEKEWLLKEIHHRVKNNLQTTISLLNMQSAYLSNDEALTAIRNSQRRMQAMSLIHQKLYQSETMTHVQMDDYIAELVSFLKESFHSYKEIIFELQVQPIALDVGQAIPLGLIINEAITNAIKYAFPGKIAGVIVVTLKKSSHSYILSVKDNGIGISDDLHKRSENSSLGLNLIRGLTDQIQGEFSIFNKEGTIVTVSFPDAETIDGMLNHKKENETVA
jgi:two-component sensor histidine kinase